jgi:hypothetical protein
MKLALLLLASMVLASPIPDPDAQPDAAANPEADADPVPAPSGRSNCVSPAVNTVANCRKRCGSNFYMTSILCCCL